jgi:hypothetical protein
MEFKLSPRQRSFLEKRYLSRLDAVVRGEVVPVDSGYGGYDPASQVESEITGFIANAVSGPKVEPDNIM